MTRSVTFCSRPQLKHGAPHTNGSKPELIYKTWQCDILFHSYIRKKSCNSFKSHASSSSTHASLLIQPDYHDILFPAKSHSLLIKWLATPVKDSNGRSSGSSGSIRLPKELHHRSSLRINTTTGQPQRPPLCYPNNDTGLFISFD